MNKKSVDSLGDRMKAYENTSKDFLTKRLPVIIRLDGCHFHSYTRGLKRPFDEKLAEIFWETCKYLASQIQGCKLVYQQSDEISILLTNYDKLTTESWFNNNLQKMVSVSASLATAVFNDYAKKVFPEKLYATFDSRVFVLPHDEVANYFLWRQNDASKNSISMVAQAHFSPKRLHKLSGAQKQELLFQEVGINWNDLPTWQKRGICVVKNEHVVNGTVRRIWEVDFDIPIFSKDRNYIERFVYLPKKED